MAETTKTIKKAPEKSPKTEVETTPKTKKSSFAVFATGGKQYRVKVGDKVKIEKLQGEHQMGDKLTFDKVLLVDDGATEATIGTPFIKGASVSATLSKIDRNKKVTTIKYKQKSRYFKKYGHKQPYFEIKIEAIK